MSPHRISYIGTIDHHDLDDANGLNRARLSPIWDKATHSSARLRHEEDGHDDAILPVVESFEIDPAIGTSPSL